ncbi:MAG: hypothetical protein V1851_02815 [Patescibacteria group bacterium]
MKKILNNTKYAFILGLSVFPFLTKAAAAGRGVMNLITDAKALVSALFPLVASCAVLFFIYALTMYMLKAGDEQAEARQQMLWGVIILFVMISVWGLVAILDTTILG